MRQMKDSGVKWIGEIPSDWRVDRLGVIASHFFRGVGITRDDVIPDGDTSCVRYGDIYTKYNISFSKCVTQTDKERLSSCIFAEYGDVLFALTGEKVEEIGKSIVCLCKEPCLIGGDIAVMRHSQNPNYMGYMLSSDFAQQQKSCGKAKLKVVHSHIDDLKNILIPIPPLSEQQAIADYLDVKCGEVDALVSLQEEMISELQAYKQAVITEAVTHGLNPNAKMKDSNVQWIGHVPEHWEKRLIKNVATIFGRIGFRGYTTDDLVDEGEGAITLSPSNMKDGKMNYEKCSYLSWKKYFESPEIMISNGDILFVKTGSTYGKTCLVANLPMEATINPQLVVLKQIQCDRNYLAYLLRTNIVQDQVKFTVGGSTIPTLSQSSIMNYSIIIPPLSEQQQIAAYLDKKCADIDALIGLKQQKIDELKEWKKSLIFECVTGKRDVAERRQCAKASRQAAGSPDGAE